jgi:predicted Holliday junction resolvase-like endonuclease
MVIIVFVTLCILLLFIYLFLNRNRQLRDLEKSLPIQLKKAREDALNTSRVVIKGQVSEQVVPFLKGFPYAASDLKFFGNSFDYICIVDMAKARDSSADIKEIVFIDIKTGNSQLSKVQRKIRDAITDGRVAWETIKVSEDNSVTVIRAEKKKEKKEKKVKVAKPIDEG